MKKLFVLYDGRAKSGDTDEASVYTTESSEAEAKKAGSEPCWNDGLWYEYDILPTTVKGISGQLINGQPRWDLPPNSLDQDPVNRYHIWSEGYAATGNESGPHYHGSITAVDFQSACDAFFKDDKNYNQGTRSYWGCKLYPESFPGRRKEDS